MADESTAKLRFSFNLNEEGENFSATVRNLDTTGKNQHIFRKQRSSGKVSSKFSWENAEVGIPIFRLTHIYTNIKKICINIALVSACVCTFLPKEVNKI